MKVMATKKECLDFARRLYVDGDSAKKVAQTAAGSERWVIAKARTAVPTLISEQEWTVADVMEHIGGTCVPREMRKDLAKVSRSMSLDDAIELSGVSQGSLSRWRRGKFGSHGVLTMGRKPWKRFSPDTSDTTDATDTTTTDEEAMAPKRQRQSNISGVGQDVVNRGVYEILTGTSAADIASQNGVSETAVYFWRQNAVGKVRQADYKHRVEAFIRTYAAAHGVAPKDAVYRRTGFGAEDTEARTRRRWSKLLKEKVVHALVNEGAAISDLIREHKVSEQNIYAWRNQLLGPASHRAFKGNARILAQQFVMEARIDDQINGRTAPQAQSPMATAGTVLEGIVTSGETTPDPALPNEPAAAPIRASAAVMEALSGQLARLDAHVEGLAKDRRIIVQELEIQRLRHQLEAR